MNPGYLLSRRSFVGKVAVAGSAFTLTSMTPALEETSGKKGGTIIGFSKPFQKLSFDDTADVVAQVGWDGIECPVRKGGQVLPERVEEDLPKLVQALKRRDRELLIAVTDIHNATDPLTEKVLRTTSRLGIKLYRLAHLSYNSNTPIPDQLNSIRAGFSELSALNKELGLCALYENHSGRDSVGAAVWDMYELLRDLDPQHFGVCFDIGHATIEGGSAWPTNFRLILPFLRAVYVKDFIWKKSQKGWEAEWCPLGEGMVSKDFFQSLRKSSFKGPIVQHHEYPVGSGSEMVGFMKKDLQTLREWLAA